MTKKEQKAIEVAARKELRAKHAQSEFMTKTRNIYKGQEIRAEEMKQVLPFTLEVFRGFVHLGLLEPCPYSGQKLTVKKLTVDHDMPIARGGTFGLDNLVCCDKSSNLQKGILSGAEFQAFNQYLRENLPPNIAADVRRRLTAGGAKLNYPRH